MGVAEEALLDLPGKMDREELAGKGPVCGSRQLEIGHEARRRGPYG